MASYRLGTRSMDRLEKVHDDLREVIILAIGLSRVDFSVIEGARTLEKQREYVESGASKTMKSRHLLDKNDRCYAADLAPYVGGTVRWDWPLFFPIAEAVRHAAIRLSTPIIWGAIWDRRLNQSGDLEERVGLYVARRRRAGGKPFLDGPHFQLPKDEYPAG